MAINSNRKPSQHGFTFKLNDLILMFKHSGLEGNLLSPLKKIFDATPTAQGSNSLNIVMNNPRLRQIPKSLFEPSLKLKINKAEFGKPVTGYYALFTVGGNFIITMPSDFEKDVHINFFNSSSLVNWLLNDTLPTKNIPCESIFSDHMDIEILLVSLNSIDLYRRAAMESMLGYEPCLKLSMSTKTFLNHLTKSIKSSDMRWILSALFGLTPGLKNMSISLNQEHIKQAADLDFIIFDEDIITFGKKAMDIGMEFLKEFPDLAGAQATHLVNNSEFNLSQIFVAKNATVGHLFSFKMPEPNRRIFNHQIFHGEDLKKTMTAWVDMLIKTVKEKSSDNKVSTKEVSADNNISGNIIFCRQCGTQLKAGVKFCAKCGTPIMQK